MAINRSDFGRLVHIGHPSFAHYGILKHDNGYLAIVEDLDSADRQHIDSSKIKLVDTKRMLRDLADNAALLESRYTGSDAKDFGELPSEAITDIERAFALLERVYTQHIEPMEDDRHG